MTGRLYLEDGTIFEGESFGAEGSLFGEVVFNTGMTGYEEVLTDPSYKGQIVMMTYPIIGSYGINKVDGESSKIQVSGFIVKECVTTPSHYQSKLSLDAYLKEENIPGLKGIDTRKLTKIIREKGSMHCLLTTHPITEKEKAQLISYRMPTDLVAQVSTKKINRSQGTGLHIGIIDLGLKNGIVGQLKALDCAITIFPYGTSKEIILEHQLDAVLFSNGPGDPQEATSAIKLGKDLLGVLPLWGICLGHQILALALGGTTYKMKFGHRGANHPVIHIPSGKVHMSSQNHGYAVEEEGLPETVKITYMNVNDETIEGIESKEARLMSVQFHPEEGPGPEDAHYIFKQWLDTLKVQQVGGGTHA